MALPRGWHSTGETHQSGQAWVYRVNRRNDPREYALKRLKNPGRRNRFVREVETMTRLRAAGLAVVPEIVEAELEGDQPYFVMPWYADGSLQARVGQGTFRDDKQDAGHEGEVEAEEPVQGAERRGAETR